MAQFGRIDILVNNAAFQMAHESLDDIDDDEWVKTFDTNITAIFRICQRALPSMPKGGSIINTSS
ncbi:SDR family oxidoreductase, partial [Salmonella enterica subsp. enterica serovar Typhimurium]|nr:SDR family oxidoreductase [Salmonella enterica subsp. enterica serovar Typhimurium]